MNTIQTTIKNINLELTLHSRFDEPTIYVSTMFWDFLMIEQNGTWIIQGAIPFWLKEIEGQLNKEINSLLVCV